MNITVTGSGGFLGQHLMAKLKERGFNPYGVSSKVYDLKNPQHIDTLFQHSQPDVIFHLAASVGGGNYKLKHPGRLYYDNCLMNSQMIDRAMRAGIKKFIFPSSIIAYPEKATGNVTEDDFWSGRPEVSNEPHAVVKRGALVQLEAYQKEYGFNFAYPILANCYGPGDRGFFDDTSSHVVPVFIKRLLKNEDITIWGDGTQTRDFLYVGDVTEALVAFLDVDYPHPVNIAGNTEISINQVLDLMVKYTNPRSKIIYDTTKPTGKLRRHFVCGKAAENLGWQPRVGIEEGIKRTIEWYKQL